MFVRPLPSIHAPLQRSRGWQLKQIIDTGHDLQHTPNVQKHSGNICVAFDGKSPPNANWCNEVIVNICRI